MSQTLTPTSRGSVAAPPRDLRRVWRLVAAVSIVLGPVLVTVLRAVMPYWTDEDGPTSIAKIAAAPGQIAAVNWLSLFSFPFLLLLPLAIGYAARRRTPVLATVSAAVFFVGVSMASYVGSSDVLAEVMTKNGYGTTETADLALLVMEHPTGLIGILCFVVGHLIGLVLLAITVVRARLVPWWVGVAIAVAQPVHVIAAVIVPSRALDVIGGWGLTAAGLALVALAILRMPLDEWDAPPLPVSGRG